MTEPVAVAGLFETHLTVSDLARSAAFYRDVVNLAMLDEEPQPDRGIVPWSEWAG